MLVKSTASMISVRDTKCQSSRFVSPANPPARHGGRRRSVNRMGEHERQCGRMNDVVLRIVDADLWVHVRKSPVVPPICLEQWPASLAYRAREVLRRTASLWAWYSCISQRGVPRPSSLVHVPVFATMISPHRIAVYQIFPRKFRLPHNRILRAKPHVRRTGRGVSTRLASTSVVRAIRLPGASIRRRADCRLRTCRSFDRLQPRKRPSVPR